MAIEQTDTRWLDYALGCIVTLSAVCAPYTKVEESFFMQAVHDILKHGKLDSTFDHLAFPGTVPRSFIGPLLVSALAYPAKLLNGCAEGLVVQCAARLVLGWAVVWANCSLRATIRERLGASTAFWYGVFCIVQFWFTFWSSRMLGNMFAMVPMLLAQSHWLRATIRDPSTPSPAHKTKAEASYRRMALMLAFSCIVLRFDSLVFAAALLLSAAQYLTTRTIIIALATSAILVSLTTAVDSYYWATPFMWPELAAFKFNVIEGRSVEWGVSPAHFYATRSIPRMLLGALPLACIAILSDARARAVATPHVAAVAAFSANAHKEWRFIVYAFPALNLCAALAAARLRSTRIRIVVPLLAAASAAATLFMTYVSTLNYPGGHAFAALHAIESQLQTPAIVHIDTYAAMTGVTRFAEVRPDWVYDKTEGLRADQFANFTHVITAQPKMHSTEFDVVWVQTGYAGLDVSVQNAARALLAFEIPSVVRREPLVWVMKRKEANQTA